MCEICLSYPQCLPQCPNNTIIKSSHYCSFCGDGIKDDEEYIENIHGEYVHYDCIQGIKWLLEWLGYDIKNMEDIKVINE